MSQVSCTRCKKAFEGLCRVCPACGTPSPLFDSDASLKEKASRAIEERRALGLAGLTGGLEFVIINTEPQRQCAAAEELLASTGFELGGAFEDDIHRDCVLTHEGSAAIIVRSRKSGANPFAPINLQPSSSSLPNTRLETFVFAAHDLKRYVSIQRRRGLRFMTDEAQSTDKFLFIQTEPSRFTGNSIGFIEWKGGRREFAHSGCRELRLSPRKPQRPYLGNVKYLDHIATRLTSSDRDPAIIEFMRLTDYNFQIAIYIEALNSITNVARRSPKDFALVFTSGIAPYAGEGKSGPTEKFVHNFGARVHHMAFHTECIEETFDALAADGMRYLIALVGSPQEGLKQTFTVPFPNTMIVNEYIHRYGDFDGFFTRSNVALLTEASGNIPND